MNNIKRTVCRFSNISYHLTIHTIPSLLSFHKCVSLPLDVSRGQETKHSASMILKNDHFLSSDVASVYFSFYKSTGRGLIYFIISQHIITICPVKQANNHTTSAIISNVDVLAFFMIHFFFFTLQPFCPRSPWPKCWTVFVDISRFVLLFPTYLQLKGLSSFSSIRALGGGGGGTTAMHYGRGSSVRRSKQALLYSP